jgi:glycosyltransferase involved in cell wall biosynthesis
MYNEEENVDEAVRAAFECLPRVAREFEVILVNDGSSDGTAQRAEALAVKDPRVRVVHHDKNRGYGATLQSGIRAARHPWIFYTDGDNQFVLEDLHRFLPLLHPKTVLTGYRARREDPWHRRLNAWLFNLGIAILFGLRLRDVDCAFKLFPPGLFDDMDLVSHGAVIDVEILVKARRKGYKIREIPVRHRPRRWGEQSGARLDVILRAFKELFRLWRGIH